MKKALLHVLLCVNLLTYVTFPAPTIAKKIMWQNLAAFSYEEEDWSTDDFYEYLVHVMKFQTALPEIPKRRAVFLMFDRYLQRNNNSQSNVLGDVTTWQDLNLFCGQTNLSEYFANKIDRTHTVFGRVGLYHMLAQPSSDVKQIQVNQAIIKEFVAQTDLLADLEKELEVFRSAENMLVACFTRDLLQQATRRKYFNFSSDIISSCLNKSSIALNAKSILDHQQRTLVAASTAAAAILLPLYGVSEIIDCPLPDGVRDVAKNVRSSGGAVFGIAATFFDDKKSLAFLATVAGFIAALNAKDSAQWASDNFSLEKFLHHKLRKIALTVQSMKKIHELLASNNHMKHDGAMQKLFSQKALPELKVLLDYLLSMPQKGRSNFCRNNGKTLVFLKLFYTHKEKFEDALIELGEIDAYVGLARLYKEHEDSLNPYCFVAFQEGLQPYIKLQQFWNPFIENYVAVGNDIELGGDHNRQNIIVTGPNAGGKSTTLKGMALNIIMAQSFGMAPARNAAMTPFHAIMTYLNIVDDISAGKSLFKAQVLRVQEILDFIKDMPARQKCFLVVDEMFNGTSPQEAQACAFGVAQELGAYSNNINIIATHYDALTSLEKVTDRYTNYHVSVKKMSDGALVYPFIIEPGTTNQHIALDILRNEGFAGSIIDSATKILKETVSLHE